MRPPVHVHTDKPRPRPSTKAGAKPKVRWQLNWRVDRVSHSVTLATKAQAEDYSRRLNMAAGDGVPFDVDAGVPVAWLASKETFFDHVRDWVETQRPTWGVRTHRSAVEALSRAVCCTLRAKAPDMPEGLRSQVSALLAGEQAEQSARRWIERWSLPLSQLDARAAARLHDALGRGVRGQELAPHTANRYRTTTHAAIVAAVTGRKLSEDPWPTRQRSRRRKETVGIQPVDVQLLPSAADVLTVLAAMPTQTLKDRRAVLGATIALYAGLRPSEVLVLRPEDIRLPDPADEEAFGLITVARAEDGADGVGPTKTNRVREVPAHPLLVATIRAHLHEWTGELRDTGDGPPLRIPGWRYRLHKGCRAAEVAAFTLYDLRHVCATVMLTAGLPLGEAAARLGHSVPVLNAYYAGVMRGDRERGNDLLANAFG